MKKIRENRTFRKEIKIPLLVLDMTIVLIASQIAFLC